MTISRFIQWFLFAMFCVLVVGIVLLFAWDVITSPPPQKQFSGEPVALFSECVEDGVSSTATNVGSVPVSTKNVNAEAILRCMYDHDLTISYKGDPVTRRSGENDESPDQP